MATSPGEGGVKHDPGDPEYHRRESVDDLPLFQPVTDRTAVRYARWRLTDDGDTVFRWIEEKAMDLAAAGERRIGAKSLVERARDELHLHCNNLYTANLARELILRHPHLKDHFELRERTAA